MRAACLILVTWYPLGCCCCSLAHADAEGSVRFVVLSWAVGLLPLALMAGAAHYLDALRRRGVVIAGSLAALLIGAAFAVDLVVGLARLRDAPFVDERPELLLSAAVALIVAVSCLIAGVHGLQVTRDAEVCRLFRP